MPTMDKVELTKLVEEAHAFAHQPYVAHVICKNGVSHYGYFHPFDDFYELKRQNRYRFVTRHNMDSPRNVNSYDGKPELNHSLILDLEDILSIEFVLPLHI